MSEETFNKLTAEVQKLHVNFVELSQKITPLEHKVGTQNDDIAILKNDFATIRPKVETCEQKILEVRRIASSAAPRSAGEVTKPRGAESPGPEMNEMKRNIKRLEDLLNKVQKEQRAALGRTGGVGAVAAGANEAGGGEAEETVSIERRLARMEHQHTLTDVQMAEHDVKISMLELTSYDGAFMWKIDDLSRRIHEAVTGKSLSIYSQPFYVGRFGYKVCTL